MMSAETYTRLVKRAQLQAYQYGFSAEDSKDLAHDLMLAWIERPHLGQSIQQGIVDQIRSRYGRSGAKKTFVADSQRFYSQLDPKIHGGIVETNELRSDLLKFYESIQQPVDKAIVMGLAEGRTLAEIGHSICLSETSISLRVKRLTTRALLIKQWEPRNLNNEIQAFERTQVVEALTAARGNSALAARLLKLGRTTLIEKMRKLGVKRMDYVSSHEEA